MADDAATRRREARRRRILMNSEGRLKKVLDLNKLKPDVEPEAKEVIVVDKEREQFVDVDNKNNAVVDNSDYAVFNSTTQLDSILSCVSEPEEKSLFSNIQATSVETDEDEKGTLETTLQKREESDEKAKKNCCGRKAELVANSETKENCDDENGQSFCKMRSLQREVAVVTS
ncbi:uncharacterized protein LOC100369103 [Saccoglossus kowalevskii]|uniref:Uncharacterized protein LOC100369103 n=1 Tax=Saccoglossus kowalevskii TaxID=10224 RepID=A0ABM0GY85_SACKO|nr:PREDICTED: uncharacterized protein LOC100369103 [Saccoglossus kowalevskii]